MSEEKLRRLLSEYFNDTINNEDRTELFNYIKQNPDIVAETLDSFEIDDSDGPEFSRALADETFQNIISDKRLTENETPGRIFSLKYLNSTWFRVAAILLIVISIGLYKLIKQANSPKNESSIAYNKTSIIPGNNKATLTIANSQIILLGNLGNGAVLKSGSLNVHKVKDGQLVYKNNDSAAFSKGPEIVTNTLTTPRGGQYQVVLEDGTKVWLNSASSISYPNKFNGSTREVSLSGEAYFEVAKNKDKPFFVHINNVQVRVLGTHFNISAYNDDRDIKTTLLEGSVRMTKNNDSVLLKPGQQALVMNNNNNIHVAQADIDQTMAWKNGYFSFYNEDIKDIMKTISRWYDVDIEFRGEITDHRFVVVYDRSKGISELLNNLEKIGNVHFEIEGRRVIVMK